MPLEITEAARLMIARHGSGAAARAGHRAQMYERDGQTSAAKIWRQVVEAIRQIQDGQPGPSQTGDHPMSIGAEV